MLKNKLILLSLCLSFTACTNVNTPGIDNKTNNSTTNNTNNSSNTDDKKDNNENSADGFFKLSIGGKEIFSGNKPVVQDGDKIVSVLYTVPAGVTNPYSTVTLPLTIEKGVDPLKEEKNKEKAFSVDIRAKASDLGISDANSPDAVVGCYISSRDKKVLMSNMEIQDFKEVFKGKLSFKGVFTYGTASKELKKTEEKDIVVEFSLPFNSEGKLRSGKWPNDFEYPKDSITGFYKNP